MQEAQAVLSIEEAFGSLRDPRSRTPVHKLNELLMVALCAILSGADSWLGIQCWAQAKIDWLRQYLPLENGIPSHDTFGRVFAMLDAQQFESCFIRWVSQLCPALENQVVAIDGKTVRRSHHDDTRAIHLVSAYAAGLGVVLGQVRTAEKSNEITAIPELLDALQLKGAIVTIDAMGCQRQIAQRIVDAQSHYVLALKDNQPKLYDHVRRMMQAIDANPDHYPQCVHVTEDLQASKKKAHGRLETRRCLAADIIPKPPFTADPLPESWPGLSSVVMIESTRQIGQTSSTERRYYLSSMPAQAPRLAHAIRSHWGVESMHWVMDVTFNEDQCRARVKNAAQNFAILRRITANLIKQDTQSHYSVRLRRLKAGASDDYRAQLLGLKPVGDMGGDLRA